MMEVGRTPCFTNLLFFHINDIILPLVLIKMMGVSSFTCYTNIFHRDVFILPLEVVTMEAGHILFLINL